MKILVIPVVFALLSASISGCISAENRKASAARAADTCLAVGKQITQGQACLAKQGFKGSGSPIRDEVTFQKCGAYWGWPFMSSCGGVVVKVYAETVESWQSWGALDGV